MAGGWCGVVVLGAEKGQRLFDGGDFGAVEGLDVEAFNADRFHRRQLLPYLLGGAAGGVAWFEVFFQLVDRGPDTGGKEVDTWLRELNDCWVFSSVGALWNRSETQLSTEQR